MAKVGKPLKYTPESLQRVVNEYFESTPVSQYTITGLALKVGSKQLIQDYEKRKGYGHIIKLAKLKVENAYELSLRDKGRSGDIFALKNFGWKDQQDLDVKKKVVHGVSAELADLISDIVGEK